MRESRRTYLIVHGADWLLVAAIGFAGVRWFALPVWIPFLLTLGWIAKDLLSYPLVRRYYESEPPQQRMIGEHGEATSRLAPDGHVRVRGEIWQALLVDHQSTVESGAAVRVRGIRGLVLLVESEPFSA